MPGERPSLRVWYRRIIALYPRAFRERLGVSMEQTFADLERERRASGEPVLRFALWTSLEALIGAVRENMKVMLASDAGRALTLLTAVVFLALLVPFVAMRFTAEVAWTLFDFAVAGALLYGAGLGYILVAKAAKKRRILVGLAFATALVLVWAELAVGVFGTPWAGS